jgi:hypothetical protein
MEEVPLANRGVVYKGPGKVAVEAIPDPKFETSVGRKMARDLGARRGPSLRRRVLGPIKTDFIFAQSVRQALMPNNDVMAGKSGASAGRHHAYTRYHPPLQRFLADISRNHRCSHRAGAASHRSALRPRALGEGASGYELETIWRRVSAPVPNPGR